MPTPKLSDAKIKESVAAVEAALRAGGTPPGQHRRGQETAIDMAASSLGIVRQTLHHRLKAAETRGQAVDWSLYSPERVVSESPSKSSAEYRLHYTVRQQADKHGGRHRVVVIFDAHDAPSIPDKSRFLHVGRYVHDNLGPGDHLVSIGDLFSIDSLNRFDGEYTARAKPLFLEDIESGHEALTALDNGLQGWDGDKHCTLGNHEARAISFTDRTPEIAGVVTYNLDNLFATHGFTYSPFGRLHFIGGVAFTHVPLTIMGKPYGGQTPENQIGNHAVCDIVFGHTHKERVVTVPKIGDNTKIRIVNGGCSLPPGHVENYAKHSLSGWSYNIADLTIEDGHITVCKLIPMAELERMYGD